MFRFQILTPLIAGLTLVERRQHADSRGFLSRLYCAEEFRAIGVRSSISQINHTLTRRKGTIRGMHYQLPPHAETKVVSCLRGEIFDVAVDLRKNSPTFLKWHGEILSATNLRSLIIPEGFAHGFQTLTDDCELVYFHTAAYEANSEAALHARDPRLKIAWPIEITEMSDRDRNHPFLSPEFSGIEP
jgi:dTDP-4-dehydrorhamnose 3,5-epimerase